MSMKKFEVRLKDHTEEWINELAKKERVCFSAMLRELLERAEHEAKILKQFEKKKRGNK